jgi:hypothetical protein
MALDAERLGNSPYLAGATTAADSRLLRPPTTGRLVVEMVGC